MMPIITSAGHFQSNLVSAMGVSSEGKSLLKPNTLPLTLMEQEKQHKNEKPDTTEHPGMINLVNNLTETLAVSDIAGSGTIGGLEAGRISTSNSTDLLSASPIFNYSPFDAQSLDELTTPDDFAPINFIHGLTNINYDFDISDYSADNSGADDLDNQFNTTASIQNQSTASGEQFTMSKIDLEEFDPLMSKSSTDSPKMLDFQLGELLQQQPPHQQPQQQPTSLIDGGDSPPDILLPSPLKPTVADYRGFSSFQIPSISCNTGDFSSLNYQATTSDGRQADPKK